jgi:hypothetical protein
MWSRFLFKKYMHNKDFFSTKGQGFLNFGRDCIESNACLTGVLCTKWVVVIRLSFGWMCGLVMFP